MIGALRVNDILTVVGHFVLSPREMEKRNKRGTTGKEKKILTQPAYIGNGENQWFILQQITGEKHATL